MSGHPHFRIPLRTLLLFFSSCHLVVELRPGDIQAVRSHLRNTEPAMFAPTTPVRPPIRTSIRGPSPPRPLARILRFTG